MNRMRCNPSSPQRRLQKNWTALEWPYDFVSMGRRAIDAKLVCYGKPEKLHFRALFAHSFIDAYGNVG
jgi:hypothetical protein